MKRRYSNSRKRSIIASIILIIVILLIVFVVTFYEKTHGVNNGFLELIFLAIQSVGVTGSLILAIYQFSRAESEISRAAFLNELNKTYIENKDYMLIYDALQDCIDGNCNFQGLCQKNGNCFLEFRKSQVSDYLTFFETIYLLIKNNVITFNAIDDLFAYRFFIAVHSEFIQQSKLKPQPDNFVNIFKLEKEWLEYRKKIGKIPTENDIFGKNQLYKIVSKEKYKELIKK